MIIVFLIFSSLNTFSKNSEITMACNEFAPLKIIDGPKERPGFDIEILRESFKFSEKTLVTKFYPWKRAFQVAQNAQVDGLCSCSYSKEREEYFLFSNELGRTSIGIYTKADEHITKLSDIKNDKKHVVGVVRGYELERELAEQKISTSLGSDDFSLLKMLEADRFFGVYSYKVVVSELMKKHDFIKKFKYTEIKSTPYYTCFPISKISSKEYLDDFNKGLKKLRESGEYDRILKKYGL